MAVSVRALREGKYDKTVKIKKFQMDNGNLYSIEVHKRDTLMSDMLLTEEEMKLLISAMEKPNDIL